MGDKVAAVNMSEQSAREPVEQFIRERAYQLYEERGRGDGHEWDDWLQAEGEITQKLTAEQFSELSDKAA
jgi:hypothetical protein